MPKSGETSKTKCARHCASHEFVIAASALQHMLKGDEPPTRPFFSVLFYTSLFICFFSISLPYLLIIIICASVISGLFS